MSDEFIEWVRKRKEKLRRELVELEAAERISLESGFRFAGHPTLPFDQPARASNSNSERQPKTIKEAVIRVLELEPTHKLTADEILQRLRTTYDSNLVRTSLSPQLSRLKADSKIASERPYWKLVEG